MAVCVNTMRSISENNGEYTTEKMYDGKDYGRYLTRKSRKRVFWCVSYSDSNITIEKQNVATRLSEEALGEMTLLKWPSFMDGLKLVQEYVLSSKYRIFGVEQLQNLTFENIKTFGGIHFLSIWDLTPCIALQEAGS